MSALFAGIAQAQSPIFIGSSIAGDTDPWYMVDAESGALLGGGPNAMTNNLSGAAFHPLTDELLVSSTLGETVFSVPLVGNVPDFSMPVFETDFNASAFDVQYDSRYDRILTVTRSGPGNTVHVLEGDPTSPAYGTSQGSIVTDEGQSYGLSEDSTLLATAPIVFDGAFTLVDMDPASPDFLTSSEPPASFVPNLTFGTGITISPDNRFVNMLISGIGRIHLGQFDRQTQTWADIAPSVPIAIHFNTAVSGFALSMKQVEGTQIVLIAGNDETSGWLGRIDLSGDVSTWVFTTIQTFPGGTGSFDLSPDGSQYAYTAEGPARVIIGDAVTGAITQEIMLPANAEGLNTVTWSDVEEFGSSYCGPANANSTGVPGVLTAEGSALAADNDVTMTVSSVPVGSFGFLITSQTQGFVANVGGSAGNLCVVGSIGRYVGPGQIRMADASGSWSLVLDLTQTPQPTALVPVLPGEAWNFQGWYRDTSMGMPTSNFTQGIEINFL